MSVDQDEKSQPIFNVPNMILMTAFFLVAFHAAFVFALDDEGRQQAAIWLGFWPLRLSFDGMPGGQLPIVWTSLTHAFLHGSWTHVLLNTVWMVIFGTPVARRFGATSFLITFGVGAIFGAAAFALAQSGSLAVLIGASGGVAGLTGLALRFMFQPTVVVRDPSTNQAVPLGKKLGALSTLWTERRARMFTLIWLGMNLAIPLFAFFGGQSVQIAWQAHIGGFIAGAVIADFLPKAPIDRLMEQNASNQE